MTASMAEPAFAADSPLVSCVRPSPNHGERRGAYAGARSPDVVVLHYTGMPGNSRLNGAERAIRWLTMEASQVSCHYVIDEDGSVTQLVPEARRAWHAGAGAWNGNTDLNSASIGIEIVNPGHAWDISGAAFGTEQAEVHPGYRDFPDSQIKAVIDLVADIVARNRVPRQNILAHSDLAPERKSDPGERFPWDRLAAAGLGLWVPPVEISEAARLQPGDEGQPIRAAQSMLAMLGFAIELTGVYDQRTVAVVTAFQRHWRPARVDGLMDRSTLATLNALLQRADNLREART
jgi:N-acetylmuramoyl-L-alanine amidase